VPEAPPPPPGNAPVQITDTLSYVAPANAPAPNAAAPEPAASGKKDRSAKSSSATGQVDPAQSAPSHNFFHVIGRFFRKLFGGS
jgi:hypothetical protein